MINNHNACFNTHHSFESSANIRANAVPSVCDTLGHESNSVEKKQRDIICNRCPKRGCYVHGGMKILRSSTNISLYLGNAAPALEYWNKGGHGQFSEGTWRARDTRAYNGGLGAEPPAGSRGRASDQGVRGAKSP